MDKIHSTFEKVHIRCALFKGRYFFQYIYRDVLDVGGPEQDSRWCKTRLRFAPIAFKKVCDLQCNGPDNYDLHYCNVTKDLEY